MRQFIIILIIILFFITGVNSEELHPLPPDSSGFSIFDIFNYDHPVKKGDEEKKWSFNLGAGFTEKQGNSESKDFNYSASLKFDDNITVFKLNLSGFYGELKDKKYDNRWTIQGNFDHYLVYRLEFFSFSMSDYNEMTGLYHRNDSGAGLKLVFIRNKYLLVDLSGAPVYQYEKFKDRGEEDEWRWSLRWRTTIAPFNDDITLRYYAYYIPVIGETGNYRLVQDVFVHVRIAGAVGLNAGYRRDFNTYTPELLEAKPLLKKTDETTYLQMSISI